MSHEHHEWEPGNPPPLIRPHSLAKHRVLREYLERYVSVLTANPRQQQLKLTLVDGFAGGGIYRDAQTKEEQPGSPLIMLQAMHASEQSAKASRRSNEFDLDVDYFFIEKKAAAIDCLRRSISNSAFRSFLDDRIRLITGEFVEQVPAVIEFIRKRSQSGRAIFVLDQFGYRDVPFTTIRTILSSLQNSEVILTFATDSLIDYLSNDDETQQRLERIGICLPPKEIETAKAEREWRRTIQFSLHEQIPQRTGAKFYTPFFIRSQDAHRDFWLIHLSGHHRARDVMVGLHWELKTSFAHYGRSGLRMLGYDQKEDEAWTKQKMLPAFLFDETALLASQEELLSQLPERLYKVRKGQTFSETFAQFTNETPVTSEIMRDVLNDLAKQGLITVMDKSGSKRRRGIQRGTDVIVPSKQRRLFLRDLPNDLP